MAERSAEASPSESCSSPQEERSGNNWWDSWISSAKNKSAEVYTMVKKDLDEIGTAVKSEASHVFNSTSNVVSKTFKLDVPESPANVMKKSFSTFIGQVSTVLNPEPDDEDDTEVILSSGDTTMLSTYKKELEKIQSVDATFLVPPPEPEFSAWLASVAGEPAAAAAAARRLRASPALAARYHKLVPHALSPRDFWERCVLLSAATLASVAASVAGEPAAAAAAARRLRASPALAARYHKLVPHALSPRDFWERCVLLSAATLASVAASVAGEPAAAAAAARRLRASPALAARYHKLVPHALSPRDFWERCVLLSAATLASVAASVAGEPAAAAAAARRLRASPALAARYHKLVPHALSPRDFWERCVLLSAATLASVAASVAGEPAAAAAAARRLRASPALAARYHKLVPHALSPRDFWERCVLLSAATLASVAASVAGEPAAAAAAARRLRASPALAARYHKLVPHALSPRDFWERCVLLSAATLASVAASVAGEPAAAAAAARRLRASPALAARYHKLVPHALSPPDFWERCVLLSAATLASVAASVAGEPAAAAAAARRLRASPALAARYHKLVPHALSPRDFWERCVLLSAATLASVAASVAGEPAAAAAAARRLRASPALAARYHKLVPHALSPRDFWERCVLLSAATLASVAASVAGEPAAAAAAARRLRASPALAARYHKLVPHALSPRDFWERCVLLSAATLASVAASVAGEPAAAAAAARRLRASPALAARYHKLVPHALSPRDFWERCVLLSAATLASVAASVAGEPAAAAAAARRLRASPALAARYHKLVPHALSPRDFWERCVLLSAATLASVAASVAGEPAAAAAAARRLRASPALAARYHKLVPHALSPRDFWERCVLLSAATLASVAASVAGEPAAAAAAARRLRASPALAARYHKLVPHALSPRDFWERCVLLSAATLASVAASVAGEPAAAAAAARRLRASPALAARYHKLVPHALSPRDFWERCVLLSAATLASVAASVAGEPAAAAAAARRLRASPALAARYHKLVPHALSPRDFWERCVLLSAATLASVAASVAGEPAAAAAAARRLRASPALAARYHKLVPHALSPRDFWKRYLFRVALLQDRLAAAARRQPAPDTHDPVLAHLPLDDDTAAHTTPITQSPEKVISSADISDPEQYTSSEDITPADTAVAWEDEDFAADVELTEEQQILLLEEYEKEIASKKQQQPKTRDVANNNTKTTPTNTDNTNTKTKAAQTRDKMNNKTDKKKPTKDVTDNKNKSPKKATDNKNKSPKKGPKTDVCGNDLVEDYFGEKEVKDDASANSDESWEKEFEIDDVVQKA